MGRYASAGLAMAIMFMIAVGASGDLAEAFAIISNGKWGVLTSLLMGGTYVLLVWPEIRGWWDDRAHRKAQPRGDGMLNISVQPVTSFGSIQTSDASGAAWFFTDELVITNHTTNRILIKPTLRIGMKAGVNFGAPLILHPAEEAQLPPPASAIRFGNDVPYLPRLLDIEARGYARGRLAFRLGANDVNTRFGGNLTTQMDGSVHSDYFDVFTEKTRSGGWGTRLRRL